MSADIYRTPTNRTEAEAWVREASAYLGGGFHGDDDATEYIDTTTGLRIFTDTEARRFNAACAAAWRFVDVNEVALTTTI